jgi:hypothetical protein
LAGQLRKGFYDLLIKLHLESYVTSNLLTKREFVVPLTEQLYANQLSEHEGLMGEGGFPSRESFVSVRPSIIKESEIKNETQRLYLIPPAFDLDRLRVFVLTSFCDAVKLTAQLVRDPIGGSNSFLFVPIIKLMNQLLIMNIFDENDLNMIMVYLNPHKFPNKRGFVLSEGLLNLTLHDEIKYEICRLLSSLCDYILRFRIESIICFSSAFVKDLQVDQRNRYNDLKAKVAVLPSAVMAKKTKEFRCPAKEQMHGLVNYKAEENAQTDMSEDIKTSLEDFHGLLNRACQIKERSEEDLAPPVQPKGLISRAFKFLFSAQSDEEAAAQAAAAAAEAAAEGQDMQETPKANKNFSKIFNYFICDVLTRLLVYRYSGGHLMGF